MSRVEQYNSIVLNRVVAEKFSGNRKVLGLKSIVVVFKLALKDLTVLKFLKILNSLEVFCGVKVKYTLNLESGFIDLRVTMKGILLYNFLENLFNVYLIMLLKKQSHIEICSDGNDSFFFVIKNIRDIIGLCVPIPVCIIESTVYFKTTLNSLSIFKFWLEGLGISSEYY